MTNRLRPSRETVSRAKLYRPPSVLDMPPAPPGVEYRWIRVLNRGSDDLKSISARKSRNWEFVLKSEHPDFDAPAHEEGRFQGVIGIGDLVLMKNAKENNDARRAYYDMKTRQAISSVDNDVLREQHSSMPIQIDRRSSLSVGGRQVSFDE